MAKKQVLVISYSYSSQTRNLIQGFVEGLEGCGVEIVWHQLKTVERLQFPVGSFAITFAMMVGSFFRRRLDIEPLDSSLFKEWDLIVLAGPTWSYSPSGPILRLFDRDFRIFKGQKVLPFISCRAYWKTHYYVLKKFLKKCDTAALSPIVFSHPVPEPWSTIGIILKMAGRVPESGKSWFKKYYPKYGHTKDQVDEACQLGKVVGQCLRDKEDVKDLNFIKNK